MDLTSKGKSWAGSMYHQFESICNDVDGFMTKETLQFVENQAQSVGKSVRRLCSSVKDVIPPSEEDSHLSKSQAEQVQSDGDEINASKNPTSLTDDALENSLASLTFDEEKSQHIDPNAWPDAKNSIVREGTSFSDYTDFFSYESTSCWSFEDNFPSFENPKSKEDKIPPSLTVRFADKACQCNDSSIDSGFDSTHKGLKEGTDSNIAKSLSESTQSSKAIVDWPSSSELSNITNVTDIDGEMETIDLSADAKIDDRAPNIVLDNNSLGRTSLSYRRKGFRYYKGLMRDAIASRKRLSKEYEQFAIMYGDIDNEMLIDIEQQSLPSSSSSSNLEMVENEWELL